MTPKYRIPRKLKKKYKKIWEQINRKKVRVIKNTVAFDVWPNSGGKRVWGCMTRQKNKI